MPKTSELLRDMPWAVCESTSNKRPLDAKVLTDSPASTIDESTWATLEQAEAWNQQRGGCKGIMLKKEKRLVAIDLDDHANNPATPDQTERFKKIMAAFSHTRQEYSVSGTGVHIYCYADLPAGVHRDHVEIYGAEGHFMVVSDRAINDMPIVDCQELIDVLYTEMQRFVIDTSAIPEGRQGGEVMSDDELLAYMQRSNDPLVHDLIKGDFIKLQMRYSYPSQSEMDAAWFEKILFYNQGHKAQAERIFRESKLYRRSKGDKYVLRTLRKALLHWEDETNRAEFVRQNFNAEGKLLCAPEDPIVEFKRIPVPHPDCFYGIIGEIAAEASRGTEAVPIAVAFHALHGFSKFLGKTTHFKMGASTQYLNLFGIIDGRSGYGRKGTSSEYVRSITELVDEFLCHPSDPDPMVNLTIRNCHPGSLDILESLATAEGIIDIKRDDSEALDKEGKPEIPGVVDKRLSAEIEEFGGVLRQTKREGNILSTVLRSCWDCKPVLQINTSTNRRKASNVYLTMVGHITVEEHKALLASVDLYNGFLNRFMVFYSLRLKKVPMPAEVDMVKVRDFANRIYLAIVNAWMRADRPIAMTQEAEALYCDLYMFHLDGQYATAEVATLMIRKAVYLRRLAALFALLDCAEQIDVPHIKAALAWVDYWQATIDYIFVTEVEFKKKTLLTDLVEEFVQTVLEEGGRDVFYSKISKKLTNGGQRAGVSTGLVEQAFEILQHETPPRISVKKGEPPPGKRGRPPLLVSIA